MASLQFSLLQTFLHWENKKKNLDMLEKKIRLLPSGPQVVILPEMFSTGFSMKASALAETMDGETLKWMRALAMEKKIILTGSLIIEEEGKYFNRMIWMQPDGKHGTYDKRHLFAYGEEDHYYTPGNQRLIVSVNGWKINLMICYDLRFPVWSRQQFDEEHHFEYDLLIYVANWPEKRSTAWKSLLQARAIENQCYVIGVNRVGKDGNGIEHSGDSMVVDPAGNILFLLSNEEKEITVSLDQEHLQELRQRFQFWRDADAFNLLT